MFIQPVTLAVQPAGGLNRQLSIHAMNCSDTLGIIYRASIEILDGNGDAISTTPFAKIAITDAVRIRFSAPEIAEYVNDQVTAQMWMDGVTGQSPKQGMIDILDVCAITSGINLP